MTSLILQMNISDFIVDFEDETADFIGDWFAFHLNRMWGVNLDIRHITIHRDYQYQIASKIPERLHELFWRFKMPVINGECGYTCKIKYIPQFQQIELHFE